MRWARWRAASSATAATDSSSRPVTPPRSPHASAHSRRTRTCAGGSAPRPMRTWLPTPRRPGYAGFRPRCGRWAPDAGGPVDSFAPAAVNRILKIAPLAAVFAALALPGAASASYQDVIRDCAQDGKLDHHYSTKDLRDASNHLPTDIKEYTDCAGVIQAALASRGGGTSSGGPSGGGAGGGGNGGAGGATTTAGATGTHAAV